ncbi:hypothetical protein [Tateyamaria pelophila]|uniref:hypothetical protein n=1 Tax=Tateyamaria pelophila TaxID=328415 RepID=UPI001CBC4BA2|nr:hypothetical protein [Tateyamaria pelophila]
MSNRLQSNIRVENGLRIAPQRLSASLDQSQFAAMFLMLTGTEVTQIERTSALVEL